jgi:site-specific recombinase XerD
MSLATKLVGPFLQGFFTDFLCNQKRASPQTVASCRDTFRLFLPFLKGKTGIAPAALRITDLDAPAVLAFLDHLEQERGNSIRSRNIRLSAVRSLFRFIALRDPDSVGIATRIMSIPQKREDQKLVGYLTRDEMEALLAAPDQTHWAGRRDHALLLTMYNSGARVSELASLQRNQVQFGASTFVQLHGKGRKERTVPLWPNTARVLRTWLQEPRSASADTVFPNARGFALTRDGVDYLLKQAVLKAARACPSLAQKPVSPHVIRHTTGVHLLQSGVDITVIALWLGHESIETTHIYVEADLTTKEKALQKLAPVETLPHRYKADDTLLAFLNAL